CLPPPPAPVSPPPPCPALFPYTTLFRSRPSPALAGLWALLEEVLDLGAVGAQCFRLVTCDPGSEVSDDGWGAAEHGDAGTERQRSEEHTSELQSRFDLVCRLLLEKKKMG